MSAIPRDVPGAARDSYDLIVVGAGAYGVFAALEAARRGLRPLLVERGDFGGATSWNSLRIVHGGLRYLQTMDLVRFGESVRERSWFLRTFPDLVWPLDCLMPLYGEGLKRPAMLWAALAATDLLSAGRNAGLDAAHAIGGGAILDADATVRRFPLVPQAGLKGAALWQDAVMPDSQRLLIEALRWAVSAGAAALNYVEVTGLIARHGRVAGVQALDQLAGRALELHAPVVLNCAGPWSAELAARLDRPMPRLFRPSLALNLFLDRPPLAREALAIAPRRPGGPVYFMYPWQGGMLAGTLHLPWSGPVDAEAPPEEAVGLLLDELNAAVPGWSLSPDDVLRAHWGLLPVRNAGTAKLTVRPVVHDHGAAHGPDGLYSVSGIKFTTARLVAERVLRHIAGRGHTRPPTEPRGDRPDPATPPTGAEMQLLAEHDPAAALAVARRIVSEEAVCTPDDLLLRRTDWGAHPTRYRTLADVAARALLPPGARMSGRVGVVP